jgi:hypothetical protein
MSDLRHEQPDQKLSQFSVTLFPTIDSEISNFVVNGIEFGLGGSI